MYCSEMDKSGLEEIIEIFELLISVLRDIN